MFGNWQKFCVWHYCLFPAVKKEFRFYLIHSVLYWCRFDSSQLHLVFHFETHLQFICLWRHAALVSDISTDGIWCYIVLWVLPHTCSVIIRWSDLKNRLLSVCPSTCSVAFYLNQRPANSSVSPVYLLKFLCLNRKELLHGKNIFDVVYVLLNIFSFSCRCFKVRYIFQMLLKFYASLSLQFRGWKWQQPQMGESWISSLSQITCKIIAPSCFLPQKFTEKILLDAWYYEMQIRFVTIYM